VIKIDNLFSFFVILLPFLYQYASPLYSVSLGELLLLPFILIYLADLLIHPKRPLNVDKYMLLYLGVVIVTTCIAGFFGPYFSSYDFFTLSLRVFFYAVLIFVARTHFKLSMAMHFYNVLCVMFSAYLLLQFFAHMLYGINLPLTLPLPVFAPDLRGYMIDGNLASYYSYMFRPSSLFIEPSYFTSYVMGCLCYNLFYTDDKHPSITIYNFFISIIISVALVAAVTGGGIIAMLLVWSIFIITKIISAEHHTVQLHLKYILISITILVGLVILFSSELAAGGIEHTFWGKGSSLSNRVFRGFWVYGETDLFHQIFGVGLNNLADYMTYYGLSTPYDEPNLDIIASLVGSLVCSGWFGLLSLCGFLVSLYHRQFTPFGKMIVLMIVYFTTFDVIIFSFRWGFYCILAYSVCNIRNFQTGWLPASLVRNRNNIYLNSVSFKGG